MALHVILNGHRDTAFLVTAIYARGSTRTYCSNICSSFQLIKITFRLDFFFLYRPTFALGTSLEESLI